jgi:hypothetical protein
MKNIIIVTQDKKIRLNYNNIVCLGIEESYYKGELKEWCIKASTIGGSHLFTLGSYSSEYICADVLNRITDEIIKGVEYIEVPER